MDIHAENKAALARFRAALYDFDKSRARDVASELFAPGAPVHLSHPFNKLTGQSAMLEAAILPLAQCFPDLERRDFIVIAGESEAGQNWVGCSGYYLGTFRRPWMSIPASGKVATVRFHEFYRFKEGRVVEVQALWDIVDLMKQANCWPLAPSLAREWTVPPPATLDGLAPEGDGRKSAELVAEMLRQLENVDAGGGPPVQQEAYWHPRCNWYGPAGIGTTRNLDGLRRGHQRPFLNAMPDREKNLKTAHVFGDGNYVGYTGWPGWKMTLSRDGWLGIPPMEKPLTMRSLDFWRVENGLIREAWTLVDLLDVYHQLGVDVLGRMLELTGQKEWL